MTDAISDGSQHIRSNADMAITRRKFVVTTLAVGFALAARPLSAETIVTESTGLKAGEIFISTGDGRMPAYRAMPVNGRALPVVLVVQEIFGVHEHIKDLCRRLAKLGYLAVAPELYARQGDVSRLSGIDEIVKVVSKVPDAQVLSDLDATVAWAKESGEGIRRSSASPASVGADALSGYMPHTIQRSKPESPGMGD